MDIGFAMPFVFLWLAVVGFFETRLNVKWNLPYFKSGIPVFRQSRQLPALTSTTIDAVKLESLIPDTKYPRLQFRQADSGLLLFREEYSRFLAPGYSGVGWYQRIMHGNLIFDPTKGRIEVIGRLNWSPLLLIPASALLLVYGPLDWLILLLLALLALVYAASAVTYVIQKKRFAQVADLVAEHASTL